MKRHPHLQPLSRQHHNGLLIALLLSKGLKKGSSPDVMMDFIAENWKEDLREHFELEEKVLIPALGNTSFDKKLTDQLLAEHHEIRELVQKAANHQLTREEITRFSMLLDQHIRFEERIYFPAAEEMLGESELTKIGQQLGEEHSRNCINYPIKFWE